MFTSQIISTNCNKIELVPLSDASLPGLYFTSMKTNSLGRVKFLQNSIQNQDYDARKQTLNGDTSPYIFLGDSPHLGYNAVEVISENSVLRFYFCFYN